jgi:SAM-dependent methyltransferase
MLWYGRCDAGQRWAAGSGQLLHEVLERLLPSALSFPRSDAFAEMVVETRQPDRSTLQGRWAHVKVSTLPPGELTASIDWTNGVPPGDALAAGTDVRELPFVRLDVLSRSGRPVAGVLLVPQALYRLGDVQRAVEVSFDGGDARPGRYVVLASAQRPIPTLRRARQTDLLVHRLAVCRCDNPACTARGVDVLVPGDIQTWMANTRIAYPCPSCAGSWEERWALRFVRLARWEDLRTHMLAEYPIPPTQRSLGYLSGRMGNVVASPTFRGWKDWTVSTIPELPAAVRRFLRDRTPAALLKALTLDPVLTGSLLPALLSPGNLRAFVDLVRELPVRRRFGGVATALAHAFSARRTAFYPTEPDEVQAAHYAYIAYDPEHFLRRLHDYGCLENRGRFLDVGCGIGEKVFLAYALGTFTHCDGLEYDARTAAVAQFLFKQLGDPEVYPLQVFPGDALSFDHYGDYDVIYMFRPLRDRAQMRQLVTRIVEQLRPQATLIDVFQDGFALKKADDGSLLAVAGEARGGRREWTRTESLEAFFRDAALQSEPQNP